MLSLEYIQALQDEDTRKAKKEGLVPYIAKVYGDKGTYNVPRLGLWVPDGYEVTNTYFVDKTGLGTDREPALTVNQFLRQVKKGYGYAIKEEGQFQIYIREFKKIC